MPTYEILLSELTLTRMRIDASSEEDAVARVMHDGKVVNQGTLYPDIESIDEVGSE